MQNTVSRHDLKLEVKDAFEGYDFDTKYPEDILTEIADSLVPVYNSDLIDLVGHYNGAEWTDIWMDNEFGYENALDIVRANIYKLYLEIAHEVFAEQEEE